MAWGSPSNSFLRNVRVRLADRGTSFGHTNMVEGYIKTGPRQHQNRFWPATRQFLKDAHTDAVGGLRSSRRVELACGSVRSFLPRQIAPQRSVLIKSLAKGNNFADQPAAIRTCVLRRP